MLFIFSFYTFYLNIKNNDSQLEILMKMLYVYFANIVNVYAFKVLVESISHKIVFSNVL